MDKPILPDRDPDRDPAAKPTAPSPAPPATAAPEAGGPKGPEPTRYGDWERGGRAFDF